VAAGRLIAFWPGRDTRRPYRHDKERTETAENIDEQALLALVAAKQDQILK
jgi:hypothetical protein